MFEKILDFVTILLSILIIAAIMLEMTGNIPQEQYYLFIFFDLLVCAVFQFEFFYYLRKAENKKEYWKKNWIIFVASIPVYYFQSLRFLYVFRLLKLIKIGLISVRVFRKLNKLFAKGSFIYVTLFSFFVVFLGAGIIFVLERNSNDGINNIWDAFWLVVATMTTVGYGDITVKTFEGKIFAVLIMIMGITIFSVITALVSSFFVEESASTREIEEKLDRLEESISELKTLIQENKRVGD
ncbi:MAG: ion transporter [Nitrospinae bacterium]|nr:ion transporter [Nitrospinota bacterium]